jgi:hypothetical protein
MPYSILRAVQDPKYCAISKRPPEMRNHGRPARGVSMQKSYPDVLDFEMSKLVNPNGLQIADVIPNPIQYMIVTERMKEFLEKEASDPIEFLPFRLLNHKGRVAAERVYVVNVLGTVDCADAARSKGTVSPFSSDKSAFFSCNVLAINESKVPEGTKLFRCSLYPELIFVRDDVRAKIEERKFVAQFTEPGKPL